MTSALNKSTMLNKIARFGFFRIAIILWMSSILVCFLCVVLIGFWNTFDLITWNCEPSFIPDFTEIVWKASKGDPYEQGCSYLPLTFLIFKIVSFLIPIGDYDYWAYTLDNPTIVYYVTICYLSIALSWIWVARIVFTNTEDIDKRVLLVGLLCFSAPTIFILERGNIVYLTLAPLLYYCLNFNSEASSKRRLGLICLIVSISIKPYLILFSVLQLREKRIKDFVTTLVATIVLTLAIIPMFGGIESLSNIISNMLATNDGSTVVDGFKMDYLNTISITSSLLNINLDPLKPIRYLIIAGLVINAFLIKNPAIATLSGILAYVLFTNISWEYLLILLIIPLCLLSFRKAMCNNEILLAMLLIISILPFPEFIILPIGINDVPYSYYVDALILLAISSILSIYGYKSLVQLINKGGNRNDNC